MNEQIVIRLDQILYIHLSKSQKLKKQMQHIVVSNNMQFAMQSIQQMVLPRQMHYDDLNQLNNVMQMLETVIKELRMNIVLQFANKYTLCNQIVKVVNQFIVNYAPGLDKLQSFPNLLSSQKFTGNREYNKLWPLFNQITNCCDQTLVEFSQTVQQHIQEIYETVLQLGFFNIIQALEYIKLFTVSQKIPSILIHTQNFIMQYMLNQADASGAFCAFQRVPSASALTMSYKSRPSSAVTGTAPSLGNGQNLRARLHSANLINRPNSRHRQKVQDQDFFQLLQSYLDQNYESFIEEFQTTCDEFRKTNFYDRFIRPNEPAFEIQESQNSIVVTDKLFMSTYCQFSIKEILSKHLKIDIQHEEDFSIAYLALISLCMEMLLMSQKYVGIFNIEEAMSQMQQIISQEKLQQTMKDDFEDNANDFEPIYQYKDEPDVEFGTLRNTAVESQITQSTSGVSHLDNKQLYSIETEQDLKNSELQMGEQQVQIANSQQIQQATDKSTDSIHLEEVFQEQEQFVKDNEYDVVHGISSQNDLRAIDPQIAQLEEEKRLNPDHFKQPDYTLDVEQLRPILKEYFKKHGLQDEYERLDKQRNMMKYFEDINADFNLVSNKIDQFNTTYNEILHFGLEGQKHFAHSQSYVTPSKLQMLLQDELQHFVVVKKIDTTDLAQKIQFLINNINLEQFKNILINDHDDIVQKCIEGIGKAGNQIFKTPPQRLAFDILYFLQLEFNSLSKYHLIEDISDVQNYISKITLLTNDFFKLPYGFTNYQVSKICFRIISCVINSIQKNKNILNALIGTTIRGKRVDLTASTEFIYLLNQARNSGQICNLYENYIYSDLNVFDCPSDIELIVEQMFDLYIKLIVNGGLIITSGDQSFDNKFERLVREVDAMAYSEYEFFNLDATQTEETVFMYMEKPCIMSIEGQIFQKAYYTLLRPEADNKINGPGDVKYEVQSGFQV